MNALEAHAAAATARGAAAEAAGYAQQAASSATEAAGYAQQALQSAAQAQDSANRAAASARTAAAAAKSANASARQATRSAALAQVSAGHAAASAQQAYASAKKAYDAAIAAHASAEQAANEYLKAFKAFNVLNQQSKDDVGRWIYETGIAECQQNGINTDACLERLAAFVNNPGKVMLDRGPVCNVMYQRGSDAEKACLADTLNPNFEVNRALDLLNAFVAVLTVFVDALVIGTLAVLGVGAAAACGFCAAIMEFLAPGLAPALVGVPIAAFSLDGLGLGLGGIGGLVLGGRLAALLERSAVEARAVDSTLGRLVFGLVKMPVVQSRNPLGVLRGGILEGDVYGDMVIYGGTVHGNVYGNVIMLDGGTITGTVYGNVVQIGAYNVVGSIGPAGANSIAGGVVGSLVQARSVSGVITW
jgi:hypothetical protein